MSLKTVKYLQEATTSLVVAKEISTNATVQAATELWCTVIKKNFDWSALNVIEGLFQLPLKFF